jgi:uncharacterized protein
MSLNGSNSLLWELSLPNCTESSYLFGTIHLQERSLFFRISEVKECIDRTEVYMAEFPLDEIISGEMDAYNLPSGKRWLDYMPLKHYQKIEKIFLKSFSIHIEHFSQLQPLVMEQILLDTLIKNHSGLTMDFLLWNYAKTKGKTLLGAESKDSQLMILENFPKEDQFKNLKRIAKNPTSYKEKIAKATQAYFDQDLRKLTRQSKNSLGKMKKILIYNRNVNIAHSIMKVIPQQSMTCGVGAGHLYGQKGILKILKSLGVRIRPVMSSSPD